MADHLSAAERADRKDQIETVAWGLYDHFHDRIWVQKVTLQELASASFWREVARTAIAAERKWQRGG